MTTFDLADGSTATLTTNHSASSYGQPVLVHGNEVYGYGDDIPDELRLPILLKAIEMSDLSDRRLAMSTALRGESTVRHWLAGDGPVPLILTQQLLRRIAAGDITATA